MKKRLLSWLLAISMLTAAVPTAFAEGVQQPLARHR